MLDLMCAKSIFEQTGFKRLSTQGLCNEIKYLIKVNEYDFDLTDESFRDYLHNRGIISTKQFKIPATHAIELIVKDETLEEFIDKFTNWSDEKIKEEYAFSIAGIPFSDEDKNQFLKSFKLSKAAMQDAWEIYKENEVF